MRTHIEQIIVKIKAKSNQYMPSLVNCSHGPQHSKHIPTPRTQYPESCSCNYLTQNQFYWEISLENKVDYIFFNLSRYYALKVNFKSWIVNANFGPIYRSRAPPRVWVSPTLWCLCWNLSHWAPAIVRLDVHLLTHGKRVLHERTCQLSSVQAFFWRNRRLETIYLWCGSHWALLCSDLWLKHYKERPLADYIWPRNLKLVYSSTV